jgi:hypothetical protein
MTSVFWVSLFSTAMKTQRRICQVVLICPKCWNFQQHPLNSRDHYSWTIYQMRVCKYFLESCRCYLQLLCRRFLLNLYCSRSESSFASTAHSGQILSKRVKLNGKFLSLWNSAPIWTGSWVILHSRLNCPSSSVRKLILTLVRHQTCFQLLAETHASSLFFDCDNFGSA